MVLLLIAAVPNGTVGEARIGNAISAGVAACAPAVPRDSARDSTGGQIAPAPDSLRASYTGELPQDLTPVRDSIVQLVEAGVVPSVSIAVVKDGQVVWSEGFGWADKERRIPATARTVYRIASVTKPITATAVLALAERGDLDLQQPANAYLGDAKITSGVGAADSATVERLLTHTGGLPGFFWSVFFEDEPYAPPPSAEVIRNYAITVYEPGEVENQIYSNLGFQLLGEAIERTSGRSLGSFLKQEVFRPLGMTSTTFDPREVPDSLFAQGYDSEGRPYPRFTSLTPAGGDALSTADDLARFMLLHLRSHPQGKRVLSDSTVLAMQRARLALNPPHLHRGLAWLLTEYEDGYREVSHAGAMQGAAAWMNLYPREDMGVVVLVNQQDVQVTMDLAGMAAAALEPSMAERLGWQLDILSGRQPPGAEPVVGPAWPPLRGHFTGFVHTPSVAIPLTLAYGDDDSIHACFADRPAAPVNGGRFPGPIDIPQTRRSAHEVALLLDRRPDVDFPTRLTGQAAAVSTEPRSHFQLPFWVELERVMDAAAAAERCDVLDASPRRREPAR